MRCKLIMLFLFFGNTVFCATAKRINSNSNAWTISQRNQTIDTSFVLINPKQIQYAEATIKHFLTGPIVEPITQRISFSDGGNLQSTINEISKIIRTKIVEFTRASGLTSVRQFEQIPWNSTISENWFTEGLVQGSFLLCDLIRIGEEIWLTIDHYFDKYNVTLYENQELLPRKTMTSFKFLSIINDAATFNENLFKCLLSIKDRRNLTFFYLDQNLVNLLKDLSNNNVKTFKFNLKSSFSYSTSNATNNEQLYGLLCHLLVERASYYDDCIKEVRYLVACVSSLKQNSRKIIAHQALLAKSWLPAIETLSDCKIYINEDSSASVRCNFNRKLPKTTTQRVNYIYENILDRRITKRSPFRRVVNEIANILSRSKWGRQFIYDVCQYFMIYQEGRRRLNTLSKNYTKDKRTAIRYKKIYALLDAYKNGVLKETILVIANFHRSALAMQKFFIQDTRNSFKESWQTQILTYLCKWIIKLLELFGCTNLNDTDVDMPISTVPSINITDSNSSMIDDIDDIYNENDEIKHLIIYRKKNQIRKETDETFDKLMHFINHVNKVQNRNSKSTLACLANNLLLVTMFMETVSIVSTLFCMEKHKDESNFEEQKEEWASSVVERKLLPSINFAELDIIKNSFFDDN